MTAAESQNQYQVRFDWGAAGADAVAVDADVVVVVDVLSPPAEPKLPRLRGAVVTADFRNRMAVAKWVLGRQLEKTDRFAVAVIASGTVRADASVGFAVEDFLAAGSVIDALAELGIDYCSPEAAAACAAFTGLRGAIGHLVSASAAGRELTERGLGLDTERVAQLDSSSEVVVVRPGD